MSKVEIYKILRTTAGGFHSWCESNVGIIRKPNSAIRFMNVDISKSQDKGDLGGHIIKGVEPKLKWYQKVWNWLIKLFK